MGLFLLCSLLFVATVVERKYLNYFSAVNCNTHAIRDHTVLPATRQRWHSRSSPAEAGTRLSDPGGMQGWVDLVGWLHSEMEPCIKRWCPPPQKGAIFFGGEGRPPAMRPFVAVLWQLDLCDALNALLPLWTSRIIFIVSSLYLTYSYSNSYGFTCYHFIVFLYTMYSLFLIYILLLGQL